MYKVIHYFTDLQDRDHPYHEGDVFPREGVEVTEARIKELAGSDNRQKKPLIELAEAPKETDEAEKAEESEKTKRRASARKTGKNPVEE